MLLSLQSGKNLEKEVAKKMGSKTPIEYHCTRHHGNLTTPRGQNGDYNFPLQCGLKDCGSEYYDRLPGICFKDGFDPFTSKTHRGKVAFLLPSGTDYCHDCFFRWVRETKRNLQEYEQIWENRPTPSSVGIKVEPKVYKHKYTPSK